MSYIPRDDVPAREGEHAVQLDTGEIIAVCCTRQAVGAVVHYHATARAIDEDGEPMLDTRGSPIDREFRHQSRDIDQIDAITNACIDVILGEPTGVVEWGPLLRADVSIRVAIQLASLAA